MSATTTTKSTPKTAAKKSKIITLRLSPTRLSTFPSNVTPKPSATPKVAEPSQSPQENKSSNATPVPIGTSNGTDNNSLAPPKVDGRRRKAGAPTVTGRKRAPPTIDPNGPLRERGRPGPKKKPRLADGTIDHSNDGTAKRAATNGAAAPAHRLGPKANTGNINANLRALDRTGKPCRKWERKPFEIKSFTGKVWGLPSWKAPLREAGFSGDVKSDSDGSSGVKQMESSAAAPSERSGGRDGATPAGDHAVPASSPAVPAGA